MSDAPSLTSLIAEVRDDFATVRRHLDELQRSMAKMGAERERLLGTLRQIAEVAGNLPDERLTTRSGANDAVARGLMVVTARTLANDALVAAGARGTDAGEPAPPSAFPKLLSFEDFKRLASLLHEVERFRSWRLASDEIKRLGYNAAQYDTDHDRLTETLKEAMAVLFPGVTLREPPAPLLGRKPWGGA